MLRLFVLMTVLLLGLLRSLRLHIAIANEAGSPDKEKPFEIENPMLSQAVYGRLEPGQEVAYFTFSAEKGAQANVILLLMAASYNKGFRACYTMYGPGLPEQGVTPEQTSRVMNIVGNDYVMVQAFMPPLPETGEYRVVVQRQEGSGVYAFCIGHQEGPMAELPMLARVAAMISQA